MSISGARPDQNSYRLDGISINDYSNGAPGSVLATTWEWTLSSSFLFWEATIRPNMDELRAE